MITTASGWSRRYKRRPAKPVCPAVKPSGAWKIAPHVPVSWRWLACGWSRSLRHSPRRRRDWFQSQSIRCAVTRQSGAVWVSRHYGHYLL